MIDLILGGARSGKSRLAEQRAIARQCPVVYIATAEMRDGEMQDRIRQHRTRRPEHWQTVEEPLHLADAIRLHAQPGHQVLVDCLTLWITNLLCHPNPTLFDREKAALLRVLNERPDVTLVSNETGLGVTPLGALSRRFVDESGWLHQDIAALADNVILVVAGLPHFLKSKD